MRRTSRARWVVTVLALTLVLLLLVGTITLLTMARSMPAPKLLGTWEQPANVVLFSPDGRLLVLGGSTTGGAIQVINVSTMGVMKTLSSDGSPVEALAFSPDGQLLASGDHAGTVRLWLVAGGSLVKTLTGHSSPVEALAFSPDGQLLASGDQDSTIRLWGADNEWNGSMFKVGQSTSSKPITIKYLAFDKEGQSLTIGRSDDVVDRVSIPDGAVVHTQQGYTHTFANSLSIERIIVSPDGQLVGTSTDGISDVYVWRRSDGHLLQTFKPHRTRVVSLAFSPDGQLMASGGGRSILSDVTEHDFSVRIWRVTDASEQANLDLHRDSVVSVAWSPDGKLLASSSEDGTVRLWQVK